MASMLLPVGWRPGGRSGCADQVNICFIRADGMQLLHDIDKAMSTGEVTHWIGRYHSEVSGQAKRWSIESPRPELAMAWLDERFPLPAWVLAEPTE